MNCLSMERKVKILSALVEGCSIRSIERMTDTHRDTIMRLLVRAGTGCQDLLDENLKGFHSSLIQVDEIWTYVKKKAKRLTSQEQLNPDIGDQDVFVALDAETKLIPLFTVGKREPWSTFQFVKELHKKLRGNGRIQLTTDGFLPYIPAIERVFGADIDYAQLIKVYSPESAGPGRYAPPRVAELVFKKINGTPNPKFISTSYVERQNLTMRMQMRRFTRLTNAFSKKIDNLKAALALHFAHYNFMRVHRTLRVTPAMQAKITDHIWTWKELLAYEAN